MKKIFLIFLLIFSSLHATLVLNENTQKYDNFLIQYLYDETSSLSIQDIENKPFTHIIPNQFAQGYKYGDAWFKFEVQNTSHYKDFILYFTESTWSTLNFYSKQDSKWVIQKNGLNIPLNKRNIKSSSPAFEIKIPANNTTVFYVKGNTIASQIGEFELYTSKEFYNPNRTTLSEFYIIYAFVLFSFVLLNVYNFIVTKESIYAYYIAYVIVYIAFSSVHGGIYIDFGFPNWHEGLHVLGQLTLFSPLIVFYKVFEPRNNFPFHEKSF